VSFNPKNASVKTLLGIKINGSSYNYTGMVCNITNKPEGFGRAVSNNWFWDG
jgi:hypothetical protein